MERTQGVYVAFQGGGARGIVHIGALRALEQASFDSNGLDEEGFRLDISGVAGTSAGAIMAALVAAKYCSDDILCADGKGGNILQTIKRRKVASLTDLFTTTGWFKIKCLSLMLSAVPILAWLAFFATAVVTGVIGLLLYQGRVFGDYVVSISFSWPKFALCFVSLSLICFLTKLVISRLLLRGLAPLDVVWDVIDEALVAKLDVKLEGGKGITFAQLAGAGGRPLRIVSTDVTSRGLRIFSAEETPNTPIADAVCASICLPFIFNPYEMKVNGEPHKFVDGGFLSNLPLWAFDNDRISDESCWTMGFSLAPKERRPVKTLMDLGSAILDAVVSGPPEIHARGISQLVIVPLETSLELLHFGKGLEHFNAEISRAKDQAAASMSAAVSGPAVSMRIERFKNTLQAEIGRLSGCSGTVTLKVTLACQKLGSSRFWPRFLAGYSPREEEQRRKAHFPIPTDSEPLLFLSGSSKNYLLPSSHWGVVIPLESSDGDNSVNPLLVIECCSLTDSQMCDIQGVSSAELESSLLNVAKSCLILVDHDDSLLKLIKGAQLWN